MLHGARLLRKNNAVYKFLKQRVIKNQNNVAFFSADTKCKVSVSKPGFPLAAVAQGKNVVVGVNETFQVADQDFGKLSFIPDTYLMQEIPDQ